MRSLGEEMDSWGCMNDGKPVAVRGSGLCAECYRKAWGDIAGDLLADGVGRERAEALAEQQIRENEHSRLWAERMHR